MKVLPGQPQELRVKYWGGDAGGREFDILVDDEKLATQKLDNNKPGEFYEETYPLPPQMTQGKEKSQSSSRRTRERWPEGFSAAPFLPLENEDRTSLRFVSKQLPEVLQVFGLY